MSSVGHVLSVMSTSEIMQYLDKMITPHIQHLEALAALEASLFFMKVKEMIHI